jgi:hypothetical protein
MHGRLNQVRDFCFRFLFVPHLITVHDSRHNLKFNPDIHTEYRDNYLQWAIEKVCLALSLLSSHKQASKSSRPSTNPIVANLDEFKSKEWMSEAQQCRLESEQALQSHSSNDYLIAGVASSQADQSPQNFAWSVPEVDRRIADFKNVHTEYRDNYHEWDFNKQVPPLRPHMSLFV